MSKEDYRVLEAMSGSGRLQIPLLLRGYIVDGVDNLIAMLERCKSRCNQLGLTPELYEQSLKELNIPHNYSTVTIAVGSFQLIVDRNQALIALKNLNTRMVDSGNLLIDTFIPDASNGQSDKTVRINDQTVLTLTTEYTYYTQEKGATALCMYELFVDGNLEQTEKELIQVTWYTDQEFKELLNQAGFEVTKIYQETFPVTGPSRIEHAVNMP